MIDEAIASAELAQPAWTYPICANCDAPILHPDESRTGMPIHRVCPDVEDLSALPLVERAAIACSMVACGLLGVNLNKAARAVGDDGLFGDVDRLVLAARGLTYGEYMSYEDRHALAEAMLRTGEVTP